jgi:transposase
MDTTKKTSVTESENEKLRRLVAEQAATIAKLEALNAYYLEQLRLAKRHRFGARSEQIDTDEFRQLTLFNEIESDADKTLSEPKTEEIKHKRKKRAGKREEDLSGLPVERIDHELPEDERTCQKCGKPFAEIGTTVRREIRIIPAQAIAEEHVIHAYKKDCDCEYCDDCESDEIPKTTIIRAEAPAPLLSGSLMSPSAVAYIVDQKYGNGMPLYRIEQDLKYKGVNLSRQTISNWIIYCAETFLSGIYALLITYLLLEFVLHADETTLQVLHEKGKTAAQKSYEWIYRTSGFASHKIVIYEYQPSRDSKHPKKFLKNFIGFLHTDGYQGYHDLPGVIVVGCWAHARRYFENLYKTLPEDARANSDAARALKYIGALFDFEREFADFSAAERYRARLEKSKPVAEAFFAWVATLGALPKSLLGQAAHYALSQREYLMNVFLDGRLELSNNRCERSVKSFVMGRKAWLFSNTPNGAEASSIMFSLVETARENGLKPYEYIKFLLEKLPEAKSSELEKFLPWSDSLPDYCRVAFKPGQEKQNLSGAA